MQTYLLKGVEVKTTGRVARKEKKTRRAEAEEVELHEVTPIDNEIGSWSNWVDLSDLYKIETDESID